LPRPRSHITVTTHRRCPGRVASATPVSPQRGASHPWQSLVTPHTARARRDGHHDPDSVPAPAALAFLGPKFVGLPSPCSSWLRWFHITDFDRQNSLEGTITAGSGGAMHELPRQCPTRHARLVGRRLR